MANQRYTQFYYTKHKMPIQIDCNFKVASTAGAGVTGLVGGGVYAVYMHSSSPSSTNPNPANGNIIVQFQDSFNRLFGAYSTLASPTTGSAASSGLTVGKVYQIAALGASTLAQWQAAGLPIGITPAVGVPFTAKTTSVAGGGTVIAIGASGADQLEIVGNPQLTLTSSAYNIIGQSWGSYLQLQCLNAGTLTQPTDGSLIMLSFVFSGSSILVQGE